MITFTFKDGALTFKDERGAGWSNLLFECNGQLSRGYTCGESNLTDKGGCVVLRGDGHEESFRFTIHPDRCVLVVSRTITNSGIRPLTLESVSDGLLDASGAIGLGMPITAIDYFKVRYFHSSNVKTEKYPRFRVEHPYVRCIPYDPVHFNHDEANHFPALGLCDMHYETVLVEGDLNQVQFERSWELALVGPNPSSTPGVCRAMQRYTLCEPRVLAPGESVEVSRVFYQIRRESHPQTAFVDFVEELNVHHQFRGSRTATRHEGVYCTWNYGGYAKINEANVLLRAKLLAERIPGCTHFLIDDGYQAKRFNRNGGICSYYPVPAEGYDREKFPNGMKVIADGIRALGLRPSIWLSPKVYLDSDLAREEPDWLLRNESGSVDLIASSSFLDLSVPEAREFYLKVLDALLVEWGYEGIKYDFMTQWFLMDTNRFRQGSGLEWRDFAFGEIRRRIGDDGFLMTCIAMSAGNPFPGLHADCYRCGYDIHEGTWAEQVRSCEGTLPQLLLEGRRTFLLNMDSAGFSAIPANEQRFRFTWNFITQGILEIGGVLETHTPEQFDMFNRLMANADRGHKVMCLDDKAFTGEPLPEILQVVYPADSRMARAGVRRHIAFFNWSEESRLISVSSARAGIRMPVRLTDFWTDEVVSMKGDFISVSLAPHSAALYTETVSQES